MASVDENWHTSRDSDIANTSESDVRAAVSCANRYQPSFSILRRGEPGNEARHFERVICALLMWPPFLFRGHPYVHMADDNRTFTPKSRTIGLGGAFAVHILRSGSCTCQDLLFS